MVISNGIYLYRHLDFVIDFGTDCVCQKRADFFSESAGGSCERVFCPGWNLAAWHSRTKRSIITLSRAKTDLRRESFGKGLTAVNWTDLSNYK